MKVSILGVDFQNCFTQPATLFGISNPLAGALCVTGAREDVTRFADFIIANMSRLWSICVTGDFHPAFMISFRNWWINDKGEQPNLFTVISVEDVETGVWKAVNPELQEWSLYYVRQLAENNKTKQNNIFDLRIWPYHGLAGTTGANFDSILLDALAPVMDSKVTIVMKGTNGATEQQGAYEADVPVPSDPETKRNTAMAKWLDDAFADNGVVLAGGEALDICFAYTIYSIIQAYPEHKDQIVILTDCVSPIYPELGVKFLDDMKELGIKTTTTTEYFQVA